MVIGGFPQQSRTEALRSYVEDQVLPALSAEQRAAIDLKSLHVPAPRSQTIQIDIVKADDPDSSRRALMTLIKKLKALNLQVAPANGSPVSLWTSASKPPEANWTTT